jgi:hypothetical protein
MRVLYCHCGKCLGEWEPPIGGDGGTVRLRCRRCPAACPQCGGFPSLPLRGPIRILPEAGVRALWRVLTGSAAG